MLFHYIFQFIIVLGTHLAVLILLEKYFASSIFVMTNLVAIMIILKKMKNLQVKLKVSLTLYLLNLSYLNICIAVDMLRLQQEASSMKHTTTSTHNIRRHSSATCQSNFIDINHMCFYISAYDNKRANWKVIKCY